MDVAYTQAQGGPRRQAKRIANEEQQKKMPIFIIHGPTNVRLDGMDRIQSEQQIKKKVKLNKTPFC